MPKDKDIEKNSGKPDRPLSRRKVLEGAAVVVAGSALSTSSAMAQAAKSQPATKVTLSVTESKTTLSPAGVVINDPTLARLVREDRANTLKTLQKTVPDLKSEEVMLDSSGRVVIKNERLRSLVQANAGKHWNVFCGGHNTHCNSD